MPINEFLPFATSASANVLSPPQWEADTDRFLGFGRGRANPTKANTAWRQATFMTSVIAQLIADVTDQDVLDNSDPVRLRGQLQTMISVVGNGAVGIITGITAGSGLQGGGTSGNVTISLIPVVATNVGLNPHIGGATNVQAALHNLHQNIASLDNRAITGVLAGPGLTGGGHGPGVVTLARGPISAIDVLVNPSVRFAGNVQAALQAIDYEIENGIKPCITSLEARVSALESLTQWHTSRLAALGG